jgi:hypothetical protein
MNDRSSVLITRPLALMVMLALLVVSCSSGHQEARIESAVGPLSVSSASIVDSIGGQVARPGYQILVVTLSGEGEIDVDSLMAASEGVYVIGSDGSRTNRFMAGSSTVASGEESGHPSCRIGFTPPSSATGFTLHWPGNEPIALELSG